MQNKNINLFNIFCLGPLIIYIGLNRTNTQDFIYNILGIICLLIPYFIISTTDYLYKSMWIILLGFCGFTAIYKNLTPLYIYDTLVYFGFFLIAIHCMYIINMYRNYLY